MESSHFAHDIYVCLAEVPIVTKVVIGLSMAFVAYYRLYVQHVPKLVCCEGKFRNFLISNMPMLQESFSPSPLFIGSTRQILMSTIFKRRAKLSWDQSEDIDTGDGGEVHLHWIDSGCSADSPIVLILPGLTGNQNSIYITHLGAQARKQGYRVVVFTYRGMGGKDLKTAKTYCACYTDDLELILKHIKTKFSGAPIMSIGVSLGAMILSHYLTKKSNDAGLKAAMIVSVPWCPFESTKTLQTPLNKLLFNRFLTNKLLRNIEKQLHLFRDVVDADRVMQSNTIHEFDENFTRRVFGFESVNDYYATAKLADKFDRIGIPLLALNANDDPFSPGYSIPMDRISESSNVALVFTKYGSHVAFLDTILGQGPSFMERLFAQYSKAVFSEDCRAIDSVSADNNLG